MGQAEIFEGERPRLVGLATRVLGDHAEAEDVVQQAWLRLSGASTEPENLPAWLTTVTTRLCLDRLRSRPPVPSDEIEVAHEVATFFDGSARSALAVSVDDRPAAAWFLRGAAKVLFDFTVVGGTVERITFRAEPEVLARVTRR